MKEKKTEVTDEDMKKMSEMLAKHAPYPMFMKLLTNTVELGITQILDNTGLIEAASSRDDVDNDDISRAFMVAAHHLGATLVPPKQGDNHHLMRGHFDVLVMGTAMEISKHMEERFDIDLGDDWEKVLLVQQGTDMVTEAASKWIEELGVSLRQRLDDLGHGLDVQVQGSVVDESENDSERTVH